MASISGQSTTNIDQVDGFFTSQGGGAVPEPLISGSGTQLYGYGTLPYNPSVSLEFNRGLISSNVFVKSAAAPVYRQFVAIKSDGTLWYYATDINWGTQFFTTLNAWTQYGTDTDWMDVTAGANNWGFIKGGFYYFMGYPAFGQRGDGNTSTTSQLPVQTNPSNLWTRVVFGQYNTALLNTSGEVYTCGRNINYGTGLGVTSGNTTTLTREQSNLTGVTDISASYNQLKMVVGGNVYHTGSNGSFNAGPLILSPADVNGPTLSYNGGDIDKVFGGRSCCIAITTSGQVRHAGQGGGRRVDNVSTNLGGTTGQPNEQFTLLTAAGSGWTHFDLPNTSSGFYVFHFGIKNGEVYGSTFASFYEVINTTGSFNYYRIGSISGTSTIACNMNNFSDAKLLISVT